VVDITGSKSPIRLVEQPFPDIGIRVPSLTKAQNVLGYRPRYDLDSALTLTVDWYRRHWDFFADRFGAAKVAASASRG
jgi:dTDP-glucose 4,6-dehydratase